MLFTFCVYLVMIALMYIDVGDKNEETSSSSNEPEQVSLFEM